MNVMLKYIFIPDLEPKENDCASVTGRQNHERKIIGKCNKMKGKTSVIFILLINTTIGS